MQNSFNTTKRKDSTLEVQLHSLGEQESKAADCKTFDWSPEVSPTPKHRQIQNQGCISKKDVSKDGEVPVFTDFESMGLSDGLLRGVYAYGFEKPSIIQQRAIVPCISGRDVVAQAQSGTGKTATFAISLLQQLDTSKKLCQVN